MNIIIDKIIIFLLSSIIYYSMQDSRYMIAVMLISIIISSLLSYFESIRIKSILILIFLILCLINESFICFIPLIIYDTWKTGIHRIITPLFLLAIAYQYSSFGIPSSLLITALSLLSLLVKHRDYLLHETSLRFYELRDSWAEASLVFAEKNKELLDKQDYEVNLATLTERNRIARDIHDNVGHLLSRSLLQTGALIATEKDDNRKINLNILKDSLSDAMNSIRNSVHDLHDESIDLYTEITSLINKFTFCKVDFEYNIDNIEQQNIKYCFIAIIKEAMANIMKHSDADTLHISIREHPALYQLVIKDNGTTSKAASDGIGLKNIIDRVEALNGYVHISSENGFRIFISIPI